MATEEGGCLEAQLETAISFEASLDSGAASAILEEDHGISGTLEVKMVFEGRLGRCYSEE
jgi:hypothetical protein